LNLYLSIGIDEVDIDMRTGRNLRQGGRNLINHGHQIEKEIPGSNPMRNFSLPNHTATTWNLLPSEVVIFLRKELTSI